MHKLTARSVAAARFDDGKPRKRFDGGGLYLHVTKTGRKWRYAYRLGGAEKTYTIGSADAISLAEAREWHKAARALVKSGTDPVADRSPGTGADVVAAATLHETDRASDDPVV